MVTSFMYHLLDSIDVYEFYIDEGKWHRLDVNFYIRNNAAFYI